MARILLVLRRGGMGMNLRLGHKGFTILEIMITLAIAGMVATLAIPNFIHMRRHQDLKNAGNLIFTDLMLARSQAISKYADYTVAFNTTSNTFSIKKGTNAAVTDPNSSKWIDIDFYSDNSDPDVPPLSYNQVIFYTDGSAGFNDGNTGYEALYLRNNPDTGEKLRVKVLCSTGKITTEQWDGGAWVSDF